MREICQICGQREAQIRFTEVRREGKDTLLLCAACGLERGIPLDPPQGELLDTREIWASIVSRFAASRAEEEDSLACPHCGWTFRRFEAEGRLGCPECYQTFMGDMTRLLKEYHGADRHRGKVPHDFGRRIDLRRRILSLKEGIQMAIGEERFEDAARLRDEMRDLDEELQHAQGKERPG
jgi:protein arginine kinase activator